MAGQLVPPPEIFNFAAHVLALNAGRAGKTAYIDDAGELSYGELASRVRACASGLVKLGLRREERLVLFMLDGNDWPVAFLGALYAGIVPVAVNTNLPVADIAYVLRHSRAAGAIVSPALLANFEHARADAPEDLRHLIVTGARQLDFAAILETGDASSAPSNTKADEIAFWAYSSGSTGKPKGTVHSHGNLYWTNETYGAQVLGMHESDIGFSAAKLFFAYGLGNALTFPLSVGATTILMAERPTPDAVFKRLIDRRPTVFFGVPTLFAAMLASPNAPTRDKVALRLCTSAGEALPKHIGERFTERYGAPILDGIGSTEMLHIFICNRSDDLRYGTTGKPVPGYVVELRGENGAPVADGEIGDLYVNGPSAALLYWSDQERSRATFQGAWTRTGDKYMRDAHGYYVYAGRSDDMLKVSGQYVSPFEVEAALAEHEAVLEAAVIGVSDADGLMKTKAFLVLRQGQKGGTTLETELKAFVKDKLTPHKYPRSIEFVEELPKTATGKIQRFKLREREATQR